MARPPQSRSQSGTFGKKPYRLRSPGGIVLIFDGLTDCAKFVGLHRSTLYTRLKDNDGLLPNGARLEAMQ